MYAFIIACWALIFIFRSNLFILSTLNALNCDESGKIDNVKLKKNISDAIDMYISRVDQAPCGDTEINLFRGADNLVPRVSRRDPGVGWSSVSMKVLLPCRGE